MTREHRQSHHASIGSNRFPATNFYPSPARSDSEYNISSTDNLTIRIDPLASVDSSSVAMSFIPPLSRPEPWATQSLAPTPNSDFTSSSAQMWSPLAVNGRYPPAMTPLYELNPSQMNASSSPCLSSPAIYSHDPSVSPCELPRTVSWEADEGQVLQSRGQSDSRSNWQYNSNATSGSLSLYRDSPTSSIAHNSYYGMQSFPGTRNASVPTTSSHSMINTFAIRSGRPDRTMPSAPPIDTPRSTPQVPRQRRSRRYTTAETARYKCQVCARPFQKHWNLKQHMQCHNPQREKPYPCGECDQRFVREADLTRHTKSVHEQKRDHECPACGNGFSRRDTLRRHTEDGCIFRFNPPQGQAANSTRTNDIGPSRTSNRQRSGRRSD